MQMCPIMIFFLLAVGTFSFLTNCGLSKMAEFSQMPFQTHIILIVCFEFHWIYWSVCLRVQLTCSDDGLLPNRRRAIIWTNITSKYHNLWIEGCHIKVTLVVEILYGFRHAPWKKNWHWCKIVHTCINIFAYLHLLRFPQHGRFQFGYF